MTEGESLMLDHLRYIRGRVDALHEDMRDVKLRLSSLEQQVAGLRNDFVSLAVRLDRLEERVESIEQRLKLVSPNKKHRRAACGLLALAAAGLSACGMPEGLRLRDDYVGQRLLEPHLALPPPRHDALGNAILPPPPEPPKEWPVYRLP